MPTLGFTIAEWIADVLPSPGDPSRPFVLTDEQVEFLARWYELDGRGRFLHRRGLLQMPKGWGKSPLAAALALAEFAGPVCFDGLDSDGEPVGRPWTTPLVQIAASSADQAHSNVFSMAFEFLSVNDGAAADALGIDLGRTRLYRKDSPASKLEAVTAEAGSREGQRTTFAILDETHLWTQSSGGRRLARTLRRNVAKMDGRTLECANAYEIGVGSIAEQTAAAHELGEPGILYVHNAPSIEPTEDMDDDVLLSLLAEVYGDAAAWVDLPRILSELRDVDTGWPEGSRYFLNVAGTGTAALVDPRRWDELGRDGAIPVAGGRVGLGFVGPSTDAAALVMCTSEGTLSVLGIWGEGSRRREVQDAVARAFTDYDVGRMFVDVRGWRTESESWGDEHPDTVIAHPVNSPVRMAGLIDRFVVALDEGDVHHDGDAELAEHVANARLRPARGGKTLDVAHPERPIVAVQAALLAFEAAATMPETDGPLFAIGWL